MSKNEITNSLSFINRLSEAVRFGNKERNLIKSLSKDFKVGVEFEFYLKPSVLSKLGIDNEPVSIEDILDLSGYSKQNMDDFKILLERITDGTLQDLIGDFLDIKQKNYDYDTVIDIITDFNDLIGTLKLPDSNFISIFKTLNNTSLVKPLTKAYESLLETIIYFHSLPSNTSGYEKSPEGYVQAVIDDIENFKNSNLEFKKYTDLDWFLDLYNGLIENNNLDKLLIKATNSNIIELIKNKRRSLELFDKESLSIRPIEKLVERYGIKDYIENILVDTSLRDYKNNGGEVVTLPLQVDISLEVIKTMFELISANGFTDDTTGLHLNISHKAFLELNQINWLKFLILLDGDYVQNTDLNNWLERNDMVKNIFKNMDVAYFQYLIDTLNKEKLSGMTLFNKIEEELTRLFVRTDKFKSINFTHALDSFSPETKRIELRYLGGKDYQTRYEDVVEEIWRACYITLAIVEEDFLEKEYHEHLFKLLNRKTKQLFGIDFFSLLD